MTDTLLFLVADTGGGHRASATAVARYLDRVRSTEFSVKIVDPFTRATPRLVGRVANLYGPLIQRAPAAWGCLYHASNSRLAVEVLRRTILRAVRPGIRTAINDLHPTAVVSFHPLLNQVAVDALAESTVSGIPIITVVTDLVDVHASWKCRDVDAVVTATSEGLDSYRRSGISPNRVFSSGLAVDQKFTARVAPSECKREARLRLGLDPDLPCVLVCAGADGSGRLYRDATAIAAADFNCELIVVCGRNTRVRNRLQGSRHRSGRTVHVHGFVQNMAELMVAADVIVTKAGPGTIAEALCAGLPIVLTWHLPGQERGNVDWVVRRGAGFHARDADQLVHALKMLLAPASSTLESMRRAALVSSRPHAAQEIGELVRGLAREAATNRIPLQDGARMSYRITSYPVSPSSSTTQPAALKQYPNHSLSGTHTSRAARTKAAPAGAVQLVDR